MTKKTTETVELPCDVEVPYTMKIVDCLPEEDNQPWWVQKFPSSKEAVKKMTPTDIRRAHNLLQIRQDIDSVINDLDNNRYVNIQDVIKSYISDTALKEAIIPVLQKLSAKHSEELKEIGVDLSF